MFRVFYDTSCDRTGRNRTEVFCTRSGTGRTRMMTQSLGGFEGSLPYLDRNLLIPLRLFTHRKYTLLSIPDCSSKTLRTRAVHRMARVMQFRRGFPSHCGHSKVIQYLVRMVSWGSISLFRRSTAKRVKITLKTENGSKLIYYLLPFQTDGIIV